MPCQFQLPVVVNDLLPVKLTTGTQAERWEYGQEDGPALADTGDVYPCWHSLDSCVAWQVYPLVAVAVQARLRRAACPYHGS